MSKCVSCDCFLTDTELMMSRPDNKPEDMCHYCRGIAYNPDSCECHEYQFQSLTEYVVNQNNIPENEEFD